MKETAICIAGAHRSGTSMLTRLLHRCGLYLGAESDMMPAQPDNPDGFWENLRFVAINDEVLNEAGGAWDLPPPADENFAHERLDSIRTKAHLLIDQFSSSEIWGWKDPRNSLTLRFWQGLLPKLKIVIMVRNPLEVAYSMRSRNGTSYAFGLRLWEIYNRRLLEAARSNESIVTHYDSFFANPETELKRIAAFAGLPAAKVKDAASLVAVHKRHTQFTIDQLLDARISYPLVELYSNLVTESARPVDAASTVRKLDKSDALAPSSPNEMLGGTSNRLNVAVPDSETIRRELATLRGAQIKARVDLAERDGRIRELETSATRQEKARVELEHTLRELTRREAELTFKIARFDSELASEIARRDAEIEMIRVRFERTNQLLHDKSVSLSQAETRVMELTEHLRRQLRATKRLLRLLDDTDAAATRLRSSRRWKMANPIAALKALFGSNRSLGYGHLEKIVEAYSKWRTAHPEARAIDEAILALNSHTSSAAPALPNEQSNNRHEPRPPAKPIEFKTYDEVDISIVIPVFNQFHFTQSCLASIQEHQGSERFEVIVVDDCSTDATAEVIARLPGVVYLRNESNHGFIASCNRGAEKARGEFLVFLNNDTEVKPGWLQALRETFQFEPEAGLVGSKLVFPDGRLQEAGGIIWRDGSGWNRGKFQDARKPEYNFLREVDYCSAACVMVPKSSFAIVGGFDSKYAPCYYEDTDLAFKLRRHGLKVFYQPLSEVIHHEGATGGTDLSAGAKRYQEVNRETFAATWADELAEKPANGDVAAYERLKPGQKAILVIDHHLPMFDRDSGSLRMFEILKILHRLGHRVTFVPDNLADIAPYTGELQKRGIEVVCHPHIKTVREYLEREGTRFDVVILSRCDFAQKHINDVRIHAPQSRVIFDTVDLHFVRTNREAEVMGDEHIGLVARETEAREYALIDEADETWVVSEYEQQVLRNERPDKSIEVVSNIVDSPGATTPFSLRRDYLFIGSFQHTPNIDAVVFFMREIYPLVQPRLPEAIFYIIGDKAPPEVIALANERVIVTGLQPDVRPYFESVKLSIAPLRWGAGVKGKINQSMGLGVPVVGTSVAVEGMDLTNREDILIADAPENFAQALVELYETEQLWTRVSKNGVEKNKALYSSEAATKQLSRLFSDDHTQTSLRSRFRNEGVARPREIQHGVAR